MTAPAVSAGIEILASPALVRSVFLDFSRYKQWGSNIQPVLPGQKQDATDLLPGDKFKVTQHGLSFPGDVIENTPERFVWDSHVSFGLITARRYFNFTPSSTNSGGTAFLQKEEFRGPLSGLVGAFTNQEKPSPGFSKFNEAFKKECEKESSQKD